MITNFIHDKIYTVTKIIHQYAILEYVCGLNDHFFSLCQISRYLTVVSTIFHTID